MHIGIDFSAVVFNRGVSRYTSNLISALCQQKGVKISLFGTSFRQHQILEKTASKLKQKYPYNIDKIAILKYPPSILAKLWRLGWLSPENLLPKINIFHSWDWMQPPLKHTPLVSTIHDLAILKFPQTAHPQISKMHHKSWEDLKKLDARIIAVSEHTKKDVTQLLNIPRYKVDVVHEALPFEITSASEHMSEDDLRLIRDQLNLHQPYILFVGTREPRKNLSALIKAWQPLSKDYQLIVAGAEGWDDSNSSISNQNPNLRFFGAVSNTNLSALYALASALVYPSLYEGFGLPILEAFHHGTPVIASNFQAMSEVGGNAIVVVDPHDIKDITRGIMKIINESIPDQQKRLQKMIIRLQMFSWERVATETLAVYQKAIQEYNQK